MDKFQAQSELRRIMNNEFDDMQRAIRAEDMTKAKRALSDLESKLKRLKRTIEAMPDA